MVEFLIPVFLGRAVIQRHNRVRRPVGTLPEKPVNMIFQLLGSTAPRLQDDNMIFPDTEIEITIDELGFCCFWNGRRLHLSNQPILFASTVWLSCSRYV